MTFEEFQTTRMRHQGHYIYLSQPLMPDRYYLEFDPDLPFDSYLHIEVEYKECGRDGDEVFFEESYQVTCDRSVFTSKSLQTLEKVVFDYMTEIGEIEGNRL